MHITTLIENTTGGDPGLLPQHGLSLLIEARDRVILFDMGQDGTFIRNAASLGQDLSRIEAGILSHGHYDHGGGLGAFLEHNTRAPVYLKTGCNELFYARDPDRYRYIGLDAGTLSIHADRFIWIGTDTLIAPGLMLIANIQRSGPLPPGNDTLLVQRDGRFEPDQFLHELFFVVEERDGITIITGCGHSGILNIVHTARDRYPGRQIKAVVGGFHLINRATPPELVRFTGEGLIAAGCN